MSTLLMNIVPIGLPQLNARLEAKRSKVALWAGTKYEFANDLSDANLIIVGGYVASGILDKAHIGSASGGLVHCFYEAYGASAASRMADRFLKIASFTMSLADIMLNEKAEKDRCRRFKVRFFIAYVDFVQYNSITN